MIPGRIRKGHCRWCDLPLNLAAGLTITFDDGSGIHGDCLIEWRHANDADADSDES